MALTKDELSGFNLVTLYAEVVTYKDPVSGEQRQAYALHDLAKILFSNGEEVLVSTPLGDIISNGVAGASLFPVTTNRSVYFQIEAIPPFLSQKVNGKDTFETVHDINRGV